MNTEQAKQLSEAALDRLMAALEQGQSAALKQYLAVMSRFRRYSWGNVLLIYSQFPNATHVGGYHFWLTLGRHVRKGERGIAILAPMVGRKRRSDDEQLEGNEHSRLFGFKACHVWDVSQTEGTDLPEFATVQGDPQDYLARLIEFVGTSLSNTTHRLRRRRGCRREARLHCSPICPWLRRLPRSLAKSAMSCYIEESGGARLTIPSARQKPKQ